ncbi:MAG: type II toxin-antitoxin system mRNA interferase toxin, RelE/StbE family [Candidatus Liptonbacteria bacterium]|nr:type II toxin-antitoxin system mRNA interferase toxin, RelE/StbE family [Parcubacteria group bacterium]MBI4087330.1 type II toxin-antitoxin system mRNA interferase toxin, RelE/StbE family [Candidatus Liptonbacteria bacterium]
MNVVFGNKFIKSAKVLPVKSREKLDRLVDLLEKDPHYPLLHTKELTGDMAGFWSFRITREWRVLFQFLSFDTIQLLKVEHRKDIYR